MATLAIDITRHINCAECGKALMSAIRIGRIDEHADSVYSFTCTTCAREA